MVGARSAAKSEEECQEAETEKAASHVFNYNQRGNSPPLGARISFFFLSIHPPYLENLSPRQAMIQTPHRTEYMSPLAAPSLPKAWYKQPYAYIPLSIGAFFLLLALFMKLRLLPSWIRARKLHHPVLDPSQLEEILLGDPPRIVDLRPLKDYRKGHIRNAINIPFPQLAKRLQELDPQHPRSIVLVDESDALAHKAADLLAKKDYPWFYVLKGGYKAWRMARLPMYGGEGPRVP
jgi:rhodanese-related sulfurtransferase